MYNNQLFNENTQMAFLYIIKSLFVIIPVMYWIYNGGSLLNPKEDKSTKPFKNMKESFKNFVNNKRKKMILSIGTGLFLILISLRYLFLYRPTNCEISVGILVEYLRNRNILDYKTYDIIQSYKPPNIDEFTSFVNN